MKRTLIVALALTAGFAGSARAYVQQQPMTDSQKREAEKKMEDLERQLQDLRRALGQSGDGQRYRVEVMPKGELPRGFKMAPGMTMFSKRPKFGITMGPIPDSAGAKVTAVTPGSPAEKAGLRSGDIITMFNGVKLSGLDEPGSEIMKQGENIEVGDTVAMEFKHGTDRKRVQLVAAELPGTAGYVWSSDEPVTGVMPKIRRMEMPEGFEFGGIPGGWLDVEMVSVNKDLGEYFGATEGVLVIRAPKDSSLGLRSGDVILSIGGRKASNPSQAVRIMRSYEGGESFEIQVLRQKKRTTVTAKVPATDRGFFWDAGHPGWDSGHEEQENF